MSFSFELTEAPPMSADITATREQAIFDRAIFRKRNIRFMLGMAAVTSIYLTIIFIFVFPLLEDPTVGIIFYFFPYLTFFIFIVGNHLHLKNIEKPSKLLDNIIAELAEVHADEISSAFDKKEHAHEIASYIKQVSTQGRALVRAEVEAIHKWYDPDYDPRFK